MLSIVFPTLAFALFGARVSALFQQIELRTVGSNAFVSKPIVDVSGLRTAAATVYDWSLIIAVFAIVVGGWVTVAITVHFLTRFIGSHLFGGI